MGSIQKIKKAIGYFTIQRLSKCCYVFLLFYKNFLRINSLFSKHLHHIIPGFGV